MNGFEVVNEEETGELSSTIFVEHNGLNEIMILFAGFLILLIGMTILLHFLKKKNKKADSITKGSRWQKTLNTISITILTVIISVLNLGVIQLYYQCILYSITHLVLILSLYIITMIYMHVKTENALKIGKILLIISSILVLSNIIFYGVTTLA